MTGAHQPVTGQAGIISLQNSKRILNLDLITTGPLGRCRRQDLGAPAPEPPLPSGGGVNERHLRFRDLTVGPTRRNQQVHLPRRQFIVGFHRRNPGISADLLRRRDDVAGIVEHDLGGCNRDLDSPEISMRVDENRCSGLPIVTGGKVSHNDCCFACICERVEREYGMDCSELDMEVDGFVLWLLELAKSKNHTAHSQSHKAHKKGIKKPRNTGIPPLKMDPNFLRNQRYARKHNKKNGESATEEE
ncbi:unnamed protein product [Camellia sinensis]